MKEKECKEPTLEERTLMLWQKLEEIEDIYLKDFADINNDIKLNDTTTVAINFSNYKDSRESGIGAISIFKPLTPLRVVPNRLILEELPYAPILPFEATKVVSKDVKTRKDIVIRKTETGILKSTVKEEDIDPATQHLPDNKNYPFFQNSLVQPISYYEAILDDSKKHKSVLYRPLTHDDIDEALKYLDAINGVLSYIELHRAKQAI